MGRYYENEIFTITMAFCHLQVNLEINIAKTISKKLLKKTAEAIGNLIGNKKADKITSAGQQKVRKKNMK